MTTKPTNPAAPVLTSEEVAQPKKRVFTFAELLALEVEEVATLFGRLFLKSGIGIVYGAPDCGKSMLLRQMCMHVATGRDFLGWKYKGQHHRAIYFSSEDDENLTAPVAKKNNKTLQIGAAAAENLRFVFDYTAAELPDLLESMLDESPADLIVIDAFGDAFNGTNTNDTTEVRKFYNKFKSIAAEHDCLILFNHHIGKYAESKAPGRETALGSEAITSAPRLCIELRRDPTNPDIKHLCFVKGNYLPTSEKTQSYALRMDENLVFAPTGDRVAFEDLIKRDRPNRSDRRPTDPEKLDDDRHRNFIRALFDGVTSLNKATINRAIQAEFEVSDRLARDRFIPFYIKQHMIAATGQKQGVSIMYKCLVK